MKKIILLQNSYLSFGLDAGKIYQPHKYHLYLVVNEFCHHIVQQSQQSDYYNEIFVTNNFDINSMVNLLNSIIGNSNDFDIITNSEETMPICGKLRVHYGLEREDYARFYDKHVMKQKLLNSDFVKVPKYQLFKVAEYSAKGDEYLTDIIKNLKFPLFVKPTQLFGSIDVKKIMTDDEFYCWASNLHSNDEFEVDEFIDGTMFHCDSYIKDGEVLFTFVSENSRPCYDFAIGKMKGTIVLPQDSLDAKIFQQITLQVLQKIGIPKGGVTHLEFLRNKKNEIYFVEIAHRSAGCLIPRMYLHHANIDTISSHILLQIDPDYNPRPEINGYAAWACYPKMPGKVVKLNTPSSHLKSHYEIEWQVKVGDIITTYSQFGRDYTGTVFMTHDDFLQLYDDFIAINNDNLCIIDSMDSYPGHS